MNTHKLTWEMGFLDLRGGGSFRGQEKEKKGEKGGGEVSKMKKMNKKG